jgi:hypothetical protein
MNMLAAATVAVALVATSAAQPPAAPSRSLAGHTTSPTVTSPLTRLASYITATVRRQPGDATLVIRATTNTGQAPASSVDLYTDSGAYYWALTESGLPEQIAKHHDLGDGIFARELAAARYAVQGDLAMARKRMAGISSPVDAGWSARLLAMKAAALGIKPAPGQSLAATVNKVFTDGYVWGGCLDALVAGSGNPQVRAGVLRLLSTVSGIIVTSATSDGQPTLVVGDVTQIRNGPYQQALTLNARTGVPINFTGGAVGKTPSVSIRYKVSRVTVAAIAAGKF